MPSSTSNSDQVLIDHVPYRQLPEHHWVKLITIALVFTLIALVIWEIVARQMGHETGKYLSRHQTMWAEERSKLDQAKHNHRVLLMGSSRLLYAADLNILEKELATRPIQLALPGTGPALFIKDVIDNTDFDGLMIVGVTPFLFNNPGKGEFGEGALNSYHNQSPSQWTGSKLQDFLSRHLAFVDESFAVFDLIKHYQTLPYRDGSKKIDAQGWKLGNFYADRQAEMWPPVEQAGSFDSNQLTKFWLNFISGDPPPPPVVEGMAKGSIEYFRPLIKQLRERGGDMIFVRLPSSGTYLEFETSSNYKSLAWQLMLDEIDVPGIDCMDFPELSTELETPEWSHLTRDSQDKWSARIVNHLERVYLEKRGTSLRQMIESSDQSIQLVSE